MSSNIETKQTLNFLDTIKAQLIQANVLSDNYEDPEYKTLIAILSENIPTLQSYFTTNTPTLTDVPATFEDAGATLGTIQQRLDWVSYTYEQIHPIYNHFKEKRKNVQIYTLLNVQDVKNLKSTDIRTAAVDFICADLDKIISKLDEYYSLIESVRGNLMSAYHNIKAQLALIEGKRNYSRNAGALASAR